MNIWVPKMKIIEPKRELRVANRMSGGFKLEAGRPDGRKRLLADWFPNLILDNGLNLIGSTATWLTACRVGTGSTAPANAQTDLVAHLAGTTTQQGSLTQGAAGGEPYYGYIQKTWRFAAGVAAGNITEVGIGTSASDGSNLFSRALILDGSLSPTTLTVLSDEFLDVTYELRAYPPLADVETAVTIDSVERDIVARAASVTTSSRWAPTSGGSNGFTGGVPSESIVAVAYNGALGAITALPAGSSSNATSTTNASYSDSSYQRDYTALWGLDVGNLAGGISAIQARFGCGAMQYSIDPPLDKDATKTLSMVFRHTWARST